MERSSYTSIPHVELASSSEKHETGADIFLERRLSLVDKWMSAARSVAERAGGGAAYETWRFLEERAALGIPIPQEEGSVLRNLSADQKEDQSYYVYLTPILTSDCDRLPEGDDRRGAAIGDVKWAGMFNHVVRTVYFSESITPFLSETGEGVVLLHEAVHARNKIEKRIDRRHSDSHWLDEADANVVEFDILKSLGGDTYRQLMERVEASAEELGRYEWTAMDSAVIDNIFGTDISERERRRWGIVIGRAILYEWYKRHTSSPRQALASLLRQKAKEAKARAAMA